MGISRIQIRILSGDIKSESVFEIQADSTLAEITELVNRNLSDKEFQKNESNEQLLFYDCTLYPPTDISDVVHQYTERSGPKSITIQSLGWYPSAKLVIFKENDAAARDHLMSNIQTDENFEYNLPFNVVVPGYDSMKSAACSTRKLKPSEIFQSVESRTMEEQETISTINQIQPFKTTKSKKISEEKRRANLDQRLKKLESIKKQDKVSIQVKNMLIKSRAEGDRKIRMEDRFYLETILLDERTETSCDTTSKYCFYSRVGTMGQVISSRMSGLLITSNHVAEILVMYTDDDSNGELMYRRLPTTMSLFEAEEKGILKQFERVIVRVYDNTQSSETPVLDRAQYTVCHSTKAECRSDFSNPSVLDEEEKIIQSIQDLDSKKASKEEVSEKVQQLVMKGKAKGDKRIKVSNRFYFEKITVHSNFEAQSEFLFVDGNEAMMNIFKDATKCFVFTNHKLTFITLQCDDSIQNVLHPFSRIVIISV